MSQWSEKVAGFVYTCLQVIRERLGRRQTSARLGPTPGHGVWTGERERDLGRDRKRDIGTKRGVHGQQQKEREGEEK